VAEESVNQEQAKTGRGGSLLNVLMIVILAMISSAGGGVVTFMLLKRTINLQAAGQGLEDGAAADREKEAALLAKSAVLPLEPFVVNLADTEVSRYLRIKISLMVDDKSRQKEVEENLALQIKVRDVILQCLTMKTSQDLISEEGKNKLRREIQEKIAGYFTEPKLVEVMFTEFVIQL